MAFAVVLLAAGLAAQEQGTDDADQQSVKVETPFYGNTTCPVSDEEVDREVFVHGDLLINSCCADCAAKFARDPSRYLPGHEDLKGDDEGGQDDDHGGDHDDHRDEDGGDEDGGMHDGGHGDHDGHHH